MLARYAIGADHLATAISISATIIVHRSAIDRIAIVKSVPARSIGTSADRDVTSRCTGRGWSALFAGARILASEIDARLVVRAFVVGEAFSALATRQSVPYVSRGTRAHRPLFSRIVVARSADRVNSAGIRLA